MNIYKLIRKLAKQPRNLNQFTAAKEINGVRLFKNEMEFSKIQEAFLSYLYFYHNLYTDIYTNKVSEKVTDNEIFEDAYAYWKNKTGGKITKTSRKPGTKRKLEAVFSKDNMIKFPEKTTEVKNNGSN